MLEILHNVISDCQFHGRGRKKWWADAVGVPPLTLSHWIADRQNPDGLHVQRIQRILEQKIKDAKASQWQENLWQLYFKGSAPPSWVLPILVEDLLSGAVLDTRTIALTSLWVERAQNIYPTPHLREIKNRLGWLCEISNKMVNWQPDKSCPVQGVFAPFQTNKNSQAYWRKCQTAAGKKWKIWDSPLDDTKKSLRVVL